MGIQEDEGGKTRLLESGRGGCRDAVVSNKESGLEAIRATRH